MAITTFTGDLSAFFPAGTSLAARPASNWAAHKRPPEAGTTPPGSATATATSNSAGVLSLTGLADSTEYYVSDSAGTRYVRITTFPPRDELMTDRINAPNGVAGTDAAGNVPWSSLAGAPINVEDEDYGASMLAVDNSTFIQAAINDGAAQGRAVELPGIYKILTTLTLPSGTHLFSRSGGGLDMSNVPASGTEAFAFLVQGTVGTQKTLGADATAGANTVTAASSGLAAGDLVQLATNGPLTTLTAPIADASTLADISVTSTTGFSATGDILVGSERITYTSKTATTFVPSVRGASSTTAAAHASGSVYEWSQTKFYPHADVTQRRMDRGEIKEVHSVSGSTVTSREAIYDDYTTANGAFVAKITPVTNVTFDGLKFLSTATPSSSRLETAIRMEYVSGFSVRDCDFQDVAGKGVEMISSIRGEVSNNRFRAKFTASDLALYSIAPMNSSQWIRIEGNHGESTYKLVTVTARSAGQGWWGQPRFVTVVGNTVKDVLYADAQYAWAFEHHGFGSAIEFIGNTADSVRGLIRIQGGNVLVADNIVRNYQLHAIEANDALVNASNIVIRDNTITNRALRGGGNTTSRAVYLDLTNASPLENVTVVGNTIKHSNTARAAIELAGGVTGTNVVVADNTIQHPDATAYSILTAIPQTVVRGNDISGSNFGIRATAADVTIRNNQVHLDALSASGIGIYNSSQSGSLMLGNIVRNFVYGLRLDSGASNSVIEGNITVGCTNPITQSSASSVSGANVANGVLAEALLTDSRFTDARIPTTHGSTHYQGGSDAVTPALLGDFWDLARSSEVSTGPRHVMGVNSVALNSGTEYGGWATCRTAGTYTKIRFCTGSTTILSVTKVLLGVFNSSGTRLDDTGDISGTATSTNTLYDNIPLSVGVTLTLGQVVYLAAVFVGTSFSVAGISLRVSTLAGDGTVLTRSRSGYSSGNMLDLTSSPGGSGNLPWIELIP